MKKMNKAFAILAGAALAFGGLFIGCSEDNGALGDPEKIIETANSDATKAAENDGTKEDSDDATDKGGSGAALPWTANLTTVSTALADYKSTDDPPKLNIGTDPATVDTALVVYSKSGQIRVRSDGTLNYNGGTAAAFTKTTVGETLTETLDRYVGVDTSKFTNTGNAKVTISVKVVKSGNATGDTGIVVLVDSSNKILAVRNNVAVKNGEDNFDIDATVAIGTKVYCGFSRGGAGGGGIDVVGAKAEVAAGGSTPATGDSGSGSGSGSGTGSGTSGTGTSTGTGGTTTDDNGGSDDQETTETVTVNAAWDFTSNARDGTAVDGVSATKGGSQPSSAIELTTNKTGSGATMTVLTNTKCEWNGKLQFSTGESDKDLFTITADADCTAVIKVGSSSGSKTSGKVNALKLGSTVIYDFDSKDTKDAVEKTVSLAKGANTFSGSGICISTVKLSN